MSFASFQPLWFLVLVIPVIIWTLRYSLVDRTWSKKIAATGLRFLAVLFVLLAMCRPFMPLTSDDVHVVFLVDVSRSVDLND